MANDQTVLKAIGGLGAWELILILLIVLLIFGAGKLPQIGDALGKGIRNFKSASSGNRDEPVDVTPKAIEDQGEGGSVKTVKVNEREGTHSA